MFLLLRLIPFLAVILFLIAFGSAALAFLTYHRLTFEEPIAAVTFTKHGENEFEAYLVTNDDPEPTPYRIYGDQLEIQAHFIKLVPWANILGLDAHYQLDRLQGRYGDINLENTQKHVTYDLRDGHIFSVPGFFAEYNFLVDAEYGSATFTEIDTGFIYTVFHTQTGLLIRKERQETERVQEEDFWKKALRLIGLQ